MSHYRYSFQTCMWHDKNIQIIQIEHTYRTDKYSQHSSIIAQFGEMVEYVYELSDCGFEFRCSHLHSKMTTNREIIGRKALICYQLIYHTKRYVWRWAEMVLMGFCVLKH